MYFKLPCEPRGTGVGRWLRRTSLTGLAQASGRNILMFHETNAMDVEYVHQRPLRFDFRILVTTAGAI